MEDALYNRMGKGYSFKNYLGKVIPYLGSDLVIGNQEVVFGGRELRITGSNYTLSTLEEITKRFPEIGSNVLAFANNHSHDRGI